MAQLCPTIRDPMGYSPPGFYVHGILQVRLLEWVASPFSRRSSRPRDQTRSFAFQADSLQSEPPGNSYKIHTRSEKFGTKKYKICCQ